MSKIRIYILTATVFLLALAIGIYFVLLLESRRIEREHELATRIAADHAFIVKQELDHSLAATFALASILKQDEAYLIKHFDRLAADMIATYSGITNLQLAPKGVVSRIYPLKGNEKAIGHDLLKDPQRRAEALTAIRTKKLTLAGPFKLIQGGTAMIGRLPVFLKDQKQKDYFWGFTIVLINLKDFLNGADLDNLEKEGFDYELWRINPSSGKKEVFAGGKRRLDNPVFIDIKVPNGKWTLSIAPRKGWSSLP